MRTWTYILHNYINYTSRKEHVFCLWLYFLSFSDRERDYDRDKDRYRVEKEGYVPKVKIDYVDEHGRQMTPKEVTFILFSLPVCPVCLRSFVPKGQFPRCDLPFVCVVRPTTAVPHAVQTSLRNSCWSYGTTRQIVCNVNHPWYLVKSFTILGC